MGKAEHSYPWRRFWRSPEHPSSPEDLRAEPGRPVAVSPGIMVSPPICSPSSGSQSLAWPLSPWDLQRRLEGSDETAFLRDQQCLQKEWTPPVAWRRGPASGTAWPGGGQGLVPFWFPPWLRPGLLSSPLMWRNLRGFIPFFFSADYTRIREVLTGCEHSWAVPAPVQRGGPLLGQHPPSHLPSGALAWCIPMPTLPRRLSPGPQARERSARPMRLSPLWPPECALAGSTVSVVERGLREGTWVCLSNPDGLWHQPCSFQPPFEGLSSESLSTSLECGVESTSPQNWEGTQGGELPWWLPDVTPRAPRFQRTELSAGRPLCRPQPKPREALLLACRCSGRNQRGSETLFPWAGAGREGAAGGSASS